MRTPRVVALLLLAVLLASAPSTAALLPPQGSSLNRIHVQFEWPPVGGAVSYQLQVVVDDQSPDPFAIGVPVVDLVVAAAQPRAVVDTGLEFGQDYAWRVRGDDGGPLPWGATHRFDVVPLPAYLPEAIVTPGSGTPEPGLTLFGVRAPTGLMPGDVAMAVDESGAPVWFLDLGSVGDMRLLPNGRILYADGGTGGGRAYEVTLGGQLAWASPDDPDLVVHHEAFPMPNGNVLCPVFTYQEVFRDSELQYWKGDRYVEFDRTNNQIVWDWNTFDYFSTLDFDDLAMQAQTGESYNWTHSNSSIYNPADNSVYVSVRQLSRITRIDYTTKDIVYNMGFGPPDMPSGDADFGDNLFSWQHAPQMLPNGNMMVYDNGNRRDHVNVSSGITKGIELAFTGNPPTSASIVWEWAMPTYSGFVGDADRLPGGNTLMVAGPANAIHEVDPSGIEVWRIELPLAFPSYLIYRADRIPSLIVDAPADADGDGLVDDVDNCPDHANPSQADCNGDGFGDVCAQALSLPVCPECQDGIDNDSDGMIDVGQDPGCRNELVTSVEDPACDNQLDDDGDSLIDFPLDPGCQAAWGEKEAPACNDGIDNDGDGKIDYPADRSCKSASGARETGGCGLGLELALLLPGLGLARRRRWASS